MQREKSSENSGAGVKREEVPDAPPPPPGDLRGFYTRRRVP